MPLTRGRPVKISESGKFEQAKVVRSVDESDQNTFLCFTEPEEDDSVKSTPTKETKTYQWMLRHIPRTTLMPSP